MAEVNEKLQEMEGRLKGQLSAMEKNLAEGNEGKLKELRGEIENTFNSLKGEVSKLPEMQKQLDAYDTEIKKLKAEGASASKAMGMTLVESLTKSFKEDEASLKQYRESGFRGLGKSFNIKAAANMTFAASATQTNGPVVDRQYIPGIYGNVRRRDRIRQLLNQGVMTGDAVQYVVQTGGEGGANNVNEGGTKPQTDKDIASKKAEARKIAHHIRISEELLNDLSGMAAFLTYQGIEDVYDKEDQQLLFGTGTGTPTQLEGLTVGSGLLTAASTSLTGVATPQKVDALIAAMEALSANEFMADTIIMNPSDVYGLQVLKATDGDYLKRINFTNDGRLVVNGIPVSVTTAMTSGSFLVGELSRAALMFQREGLSARFFDQDQDNAVKNLVTVVIEERIALAKPYQNAIFFDSFSDVITAIS